MSWLTRWLPKKIRVGSPKKKTIPEGLWFQCPACSAMLYRQDFDRALRVCATCQHHDPLSASDRIDFFLDPEPRIFLAEEVGAADPLRFRDTKKYKDRLNEAKKSTGAEEALWVVEGAILGVPLVCAVFEFDFIGGSMGSAVGERFVRAVMHAKNKKLPLICVTASGGARMQEGLLALFQMGKTSMALEIFSRAGLPYLTLLTHPTMGGVSASLAMLGDIVMAEPGALIGFAGPRVIEQTMRQSLPENFQKSECLLEHGAIDALVPRAQQREYCARALAFLMHRPPPFSA